MFFEEGKVLGVGVNVASRIQSLGTENTILFSGEIQDKIKNQPFFKSVSLGSIEFKNVNEPMEVFALTNEGLSIPKRQAMSGKVKDHGSNKAISAPKKWMAILLVFAILIVTGVYLSNRFGNVNQFSGLEKSIAVLPIVNIGKDPKKEYFSEGVTEEITTRLSKIADLKVISRTTAMLYKNTKKPVKQIATEMNVASLLEGSVRKSGDEIRITVQLVDAYTQKQIWAEQYQHRNLRAIFSIQSAMAQQIAQELNVQLAFG